MGVERVILVWVVWALLVALVAAPAAQLREKGNEVVFSVIAPDTAPAASVG